MFEKPLSEILKSLRVDSGLTQESFAAEFDIAKRRWSHFETARCQPNAQEVERLESRFGKLRGCIHPPGAQRRFKENALSHRTAPVLFLPPMDRGPHVRLFTARQQYGPFVDRLTRVIRARADFEYCQALCEMLSLGSADEALFVLRLLEHGALPGMIAPASLGRLRHPAVDPSSREEISHRPLPCLSFPGDYYFFQISLSTPRLYTVDVLRWNGAWSIVEIDGRGHDFHGDQIRAFHLGLPERRLSPQAIMADGFTFNPKPKAA